MLGKVLGFIGVGVLVCLNLKHDYIIYKKRKDGEYAGERYEK